MAIISKTIETKPISISADGQRTAVPSETLLKLDPKLERARELISKGDYQRALDSLSAATRDLEVRNTCAVCLIRMHRFAQAIDLLRTVTVNSQINKVRDDVPDHIRINFAIALFFGGQPAGALEALREINREDDSSVKMLREQTRRWVAEMGFFRRLDWRLNSVAPKALPVPPDEPLGKCVWEFVNQKN